MEGDRNTAKPLKKSINPGAGVLKDQQNGPLARLIKKRIIK